MLFEGRTVNQVLGTRQIDLSQWIARGQVKPTQPSVRGCGNHRNLYSPENICQIKLFRDLIDCGIKASVASTIAFDEDILRVIGEIIEGTKARNLLAPGIYIAVVKKPKKWQAIIIKDVEEIVDLYRKNEGLIILLNLDRMVKAVTILLEVIKKS